MGNWRDRIGKWAAKKAVQISLNRMKKDAEAIKEVMEFLDRFHFTINDAGARFIKDEQWFLDDLDELNKFTTKW